jgi:hypothetical protein
MACGLDRVRVASDSQQGSVLQAWPAWAPLALGLGGLEIFQAVALGLDVSGPVMADQAFRACHSGSLLADLAQRGWCLG